MLALNSIYIQVAAVTFSTTSNGYVRCSLQKDQPTLCRLNKIEIVFVLIYLFDFNIYNALFVEVSLLYNICSTKGQLEHHILRLIFLVSPWIVYSSDF